jgi:hypothetical protein
MIYNGLETTKFAFPHFIFPKTVKFSTFLNPDNKILEGI